MSAEEFRTAGHRLVDRIAEFLGSVADMSVTPGQSPSAVRQALNAEQGLPESGADAATLLDRAAQLVFDHSLFNAHPRFWGYVTAGAAPIGMLGELLASAANPNCGAWLLSPMASEIEGQTIRWIAEMLKYPTDCGGLFVSGGNMANIVGFLAGRAAKGGPEIRSKGVDGRRLRAYCSAETHTWIQKAADIAGLGTESVRWIAADDGFRIDVEALRSRIRQDIASGDKPFLVIGNAGTVSTGAVDDLKALAELCREFGLWFHVDGAYGAMAAGAPEASQLFEGLELADSLAVDPHKWLYAPIEAGCTLVRDVASLRDAFSYHPAYYHFGVEATNYFDLGPQNSRGFRALKVWLALQHAGREGYAQMISDDIRLSRAMYDAVSRHPELQALTQGLSIATFRYVPTEVDRSDQAGDEYLNKLNQELLTRLQQGGEAYLSNAVIGGKYALRACIVNFRTTLEDVESVPDLVVRIGRDVHAELRQRTAV
ncbi:pyridoxal phosphate-dependent decarboxylase family protein [Occallatibacter savannae]|uniref:pyridoxal phosphate-dependent decarboxylase family protein n=1 Tax=Occallatibacter savannae TaxID=1002691 RepID=UPI001950F4D2|nr:aspartate aminotransferase family protein [Occallatibacter savannae]